MATKLSGPMVAPRSGVARQAVVLLHGYGSDGQDLIGLAGVWRDVLPDAVFVAPNAPEPCRDNPSGYQWFPIDHDRPGYRLEGAAAAAPVIGDFLADLWRQTGLSAGQTLLGGFSQGAMMALHVGLQIDPPLLGILAFSGALIAPPGLADLTGRKPPVCLVHGERDGVVDADFSAQAAAALGGLGYDVRFHIQPGAPHTITEDGLDFATTFIRELVDGVPAGPA